MLCAGTRRGTRFRSWTCEAGGWRTWTQSWRTRRRASISWSPPDGTRIIWSTTVDASQADAPEGTSRCSVTITGGDGSSAETLLEKRYDNLYHLEPVTWTREDDAIFFARMRVWVESGGAFIPTLSGRYSELFRLDLASGEFQKAFPLDDAADCNRCIGDVSPDGHWLAYHREDGALILRDLVGGEETLVAGASSACYLGRARFSPHGEHLVYTELEGPCDERDTFDVARTVMVDVPFEGTSRLLAESTEAVDWPVGWLDGETSIFDRVYKGFDQRGLGVAGHPSAPEDLLPGILIGVVRPNVEDERWFTGEARSERGQVSSSDRDGETWWPDPETGGLEFAD